MSTVKAQLFYSSPPADGSQPYSDVTPDPKTGRRQTNIVHEGHQVEIENVRGKEDQFTLDTNGFQFHTHASKHKAFTDDAEIQKEYYPESEQLIKDITGASRVVLFDHTIRRRIPGQSDETGNTPGQSDDTGNRQPAAFVHVDQTQKASVARVHRHVPSDAPSLVRRRFQIINLWRPINHPAFDWPLALCDYRSTNSGEGGDFVPTQLRYPNFIGETMAVKHNPEHKWKYLRGMQPDEFVLIKCSESETKEGIAKCTPHTAFEDPTTPPDAPFRESIELRALVFYD